MTCEREFEEGRMDGIMGRECSTRYRLPEKKEAYKKGYQQGVNERQDQQAEESIRKMSPEEKTEASQNIKRLRDIITNN